MDENVKWFLNLQIERVIDSLKKRNMLGIYVRDRTELIETLKGLIPENSVVGVGDSMTLEELGVYDFLKNGGFRYLDKHNSQITKEEKKELYLKNFSADSFLSGANAVTEAGEIFNIDGNGSRVAPIIYGPSQVLVIVGTNKIVRDMDEAYDRVRNYSAPIDAKRLNKKTPCTAKGKCFDCASPDRICNAFVTISGQFVKDRIKVIIIDENLGY